jgi:hypothetical protein
MRWQRPSGASIELTRESHPAARGWQPAWEMAKPTFDEKIVVHQPKDVVSLERG